MNKKLLVMAVAGALALPGIALAQVTISGSFRTALVNQRISDPSAARASSNKNETRIADDVTTLVFQAREDLGGMAAFGYLQLRPLLDNNIPFANMVASGGSSVPQAYMGIESNSWGTLRIGTINSVQYYGGTAGGYHVQKGWSTTSNLAILGTAAGGAITSTGGPARLRNAVTYNSPSFGGLNLTMQYTSNAYYSDADLQADATGAIKNRKGNGFIISPEYKAATWRAGYSYAKLRPDAVFPAAVAGVTLPNSVAGFVTCNSYVVAGACGAVNGATISNGSQDDRGDRLWGEMTIAGIKAGLTWDKYRTNNVFTGAKSSERNAWGIDAQYSTGAHDINLSYAKANRDKVLVGDTSAKQWVVGYVYNLSKRTNVGLTYVSLKNGAAANYGNAQWGATAYTAQGAGVLVGEDIRGAAMTFQHMF